MSAGRKGYAHHRVHPVPAPVRRRFSWESYALWVLFGLAVLASVLYVVGAL